MTGLATITKLSSQSSSPRNATGERKDSKRFTIFVEPRDRGVALDLLGGKPCFVRTIKVMAEVPVSPFSQERVFIGLTRAVNSEQDGRAQH